MLCLLVSWLCWTTQKDVSALYLLEQTEIEVSQAIAQKINREIWIGEDRIRVDIGEEVTLIYALNLQTLFVIDHLDKKYFYALTGRNKKILRTPLFSIARLRNGLLQVPDNAVVQSVGIKEQVGDWSCFKYELKQNTKNKIQTIIWSTNEQSFIAKSDIRKMWFSAFGSSPPVDVRHVLNEILGKIEGVPVKIQMIAKQGGFAVKTTQTITHIEVHDKLPENFFEIPSTYDVVPRQAP